MSTPDTGGPAFPRPAGGYNGTAHGNGAQADAMIRARAAIAASR